MLVLPDAFSGEINVGKLHKAKWTEVSSGNFVVITNAKEKQAHAMVRELEQFRHFLALLLGYKQRELPQKIPVVLAKDEKTFTNMGLPPEYAGLFVQQNDQPLIFANSKGFSSSSDGKASLGRQVVLHELVHLLMNNASIELANPPWYSEGTAEYFGSYVEKKGEVVIGDLSLLQDRFYSLLKPSGAGFQSVDTESLFKASEVGIKVDMNRREQKDIGKFYARSLAVVHYLNADPERRKKMYQYLYLINKGYSVDEVFKSVFQMTFDELDRRLDEYISGKFVLVRTFSGIKYPEFQFSTRALAQREAMGFLVSRIAMVRGTSLIEDGNIEAMYSDVRKIYPDLFPENKDGETL